MSDKIQIYIGNCARCGERRPLNAATNACLSLSDCLERQLALVQAQAVAMRLAARNLLRAEAGEQHPSLNADTYDYMLTELAEVLESTDAGQALLAERDAARAVVAALRRLKGICPLCGFEKRLDGSPFHGSGCPRAAYDASEARGWRPETSGRAG